MAGFRKPELPREQMVLWATRLEDAIPADHPVRHLVFLFEREPFMGTFKAWEQEYVLLEGKPPYHPRDLAALYLYGMMNRLRSSRQLEAACYNRLDVIWLLAGQKPDHSTIAAFVTAHGQRLRQLFRDTLSLGLRAGLVKLEHVSVDGTKIEADAGRGSVHQQATLETALAEVDEQIAALEKEWQDNERREGSLFGDNVPWIPPGGKNALQQLKRTQARLTEALAELQRRVREGGPATKAIASTTDPDARAMKDKEGKSKPNYNAQIGVDAAEGMIVAEAVNDRPEDCGQLTPMLQETAENCGKLPLEVSADSGYNSGAELAELEKNGVQGFLPDSGQRSEIPKEGTAESAALAAAQAGEQLSDAQWAALPKDGQKRITKAAFRYDAVADHYLCPMGQVLPFLRLSQAERVGGVSLRNQYGGCAACVSCPRSAMCCSNPRTGRVINRDQYEPHRERMRERMKSEHGRERYRLRGPTVEPRFGHIKRGLGVRRFMRRGLEQVRTEWSMVCTAVNLGVLLRCWTAVSAALA